MKRSKTIITNNNRPAVASSAPADLPEITKRVMVHLLAKPAKATIRGPEAAPPAGEEKRAGRGNEMKFIVGVQVYLQNTPNGNSPLVVVEQAINVVKPEPGENPTLEQMAHFAIQIYAETHRKALGYPMEAKGEGYTMNLRSATSEVGRSTAKEAVDAEESNGGAHNEGRSK